MPELSEAFINDDAYSLTSFTTEWINCSSANNLTFTSYCSESYTTGVRWSVDSNLFVIDETTVNKLAGENHELYVPVTARFVQFFISNIGSTPAELRCQGFFYINSGGIFNQTAGITGPVGATGPAGATGATGPAASVTLTSAGGAESLVVDGVSPTLSIKGLSSGGTVSLISDANSVTINGASTDVSLTNAGIGSTLVSDGVGPSLSTKSVTAGTNIVFNDTGTDITINSTAGGSSVFQQVGDQIEPITTTETTLIGGRDNIVNTGVKNSIVWGSNNNMSVGVVDQLAVIGSTGCSLINNGIGDNIGFLYSTDCTQTLAGAGFTENSCIIASRNSQTHAGGGGDRSNGRCVCVGTLNCRIGGVGGVTRDSFQVGIYSSSNCVCDNYSGTCCSGIVFCNECDLGTQTPSGADADQLFIIGSTGCTLGTNDNNERDTDCIISSKNTCEINGDARNVTILNCDNSNIFGIEQFKAVTNTMINCTDSDITSIFAGNGQCTRNTMINSLNSSLRFDDNVLLNTHGVTGTHKGNVIAGDSLTGFSSESDDQCLMKFTNGYKFYTNGLLTTGMVAGAGSNSFGAICERRFKENIHEVNYLDILNRVDKLPIYKYNYRGNHPAQKNISPMAEEYHKQFGFLDGGLKNIKIIETMDLLGICLSSIKGLKETIKKQQLEIDQLKSRKSQTIISSDPQNILVEIKKLKDRVRILELQN